MGFSLRYLLGSPSDEDLKQQALMLKQLTTATISLNEIAKETLELARENNRLLCEQDSLLKEQNRYLNQLVERQPAVVTTPKSRRSKK